MIIKYIITDIDEVVIGNTGHLNLKKATVGNIISAGRLKIENGKLKTYYKSDTYDIPSKQEDADKIIKLLRV